MIYHLVVIIIIHLIGDFALQSREMGLNKGKSIMWLSIHVGVYLITLLLFGFMLGHYVVDGPDSMIIVLEYCVLNATLHWVTDFFTSKLSGLFYLKMNKAKGIGDKKNELMWQYFFWLMIGIDFTIHILTLIITYDLFFIK